MNNINEPISVNRQHKDRLFRLLFGDAGQKENILSLYNALNGTDYKNPEDLTITTLEDAIYIKMKNDVSFLIDSCLSLWEQQSTYNPNMPLRGFMYFGNLYNKYIQENEQNIYGSRLVRIPTPRFIIFYNGTKNKPPVMKLKLSEAFIKPAEEGEFEWTATMINLNEGKTPELLSKCKTLSDYMELINRIRYYRGQGKGIKEAVDHAVAECIERGILADFLRSHKAEVLMECLTEFNEKTYRKGIYEEGREEGLREGHEEGLREGRKEGLREGHEEGLREGHKEGLREGRVSLIRTMIARGNTPEQISDMTGISLEEIEGLVE